MNEKSEDKRKAQPESNVQPDRDAAGERGLTSKEMAQFLSVSESWLAKSRMRGDGPPYAKMGRIVRYFPTMAATWLKSRRRLSTSE